MTIIQWPKEERPREKLLSNGATHLSSAELLAIVLHTGCRGKSALQLARELLIQFGGLGALLAAETQTLCQSPGLGSAKAARLQAVQELAQRLVLEEMQSGELLSSSAATRRYLLSKYRHTDYEVFSLIFLNNQHHVVKFEEMFRGTIDGAAVYPREVVKRCLDLNAAAVIFAHNHPSGIAEPSPADRAITGRLKQALSTIDVRVLDHFIVGANEVVSMAERQLL